MTTVTVTFTDEELVKLKELAGRKGIALEDMLRENAREILTREEEFQEALTAVLAENAELLRRLA